MKALDFFCGGGGMTYGFRAAGVQVVGGIDIDKQCQATYEINNPGSRFVHADLQSLNVRSLAKEFRLRKRDDELVFIGCSPCQYWSIIKTDKSRARASRNLLVEFQGFVEHFLPGFIVIENVPGIFFNLRSPLPGFLACLQRSGYCWIKFDTINVLDYGVPQTRRRFILIASRVGPVDLPRTVDSSGLTVRNFIGDQRIFPPVEAGHKDDSDFCHTVAGLRSESLARLAMTPQDGGSRSAWEDSPLQLEVYRKKQGDQRFGFRDSYGRLWWERPASTITTKFFGISHGRFAHPDQDRAISVREAATLQTFPLDYSFQVRSLESKARMIGNAVPPVLARKIAEAISHK